MESDTEYSRDNARSPIEYDPADFISDRHLEAIYEVVTERTDFRDLVQSVQKNDDIITTEAAKVSLAFGARNVLPVGVESSYPTLVRKPKESPPISPEDLAYQSLPFSIHKTEDFVSGSPGYVGPIYHLQFDGGPNMVVNVTRGKNQDHETGFVIHTLR